MIVGDSSRVVGSSISRTIVGSGSERQRSVGLVRRRVSTKETGVSPAAATTAAASDGGLTISIVGPSPVSISAKPTAASAGPIGVPPGTTTSSMVIET